MQPCYHNQSRPCHVCLCVDHSPSDLLPLRLYGNTKQSHTHRREKASGVLQACKIYEIHIDDRGDEGLKASCYSSADPERHTGMFWQSQMDGNKTTNTLLSDPAQLQTLSHGPSPNGSHTASFESPEHPHSSVSSHNRSNTSRIAMDC